MAKPQKPLKGAQTELDQLGKMDGRRNAEPSVNSQIRRRLRGAKYRAASGSKGRSGNGSGRYGYPQRVTVKAPVSRHKLGKAAGSLKRHVSYVGRESASQDGQPGVFYDQTRTNVQAKEEVAAWENDRHHFRLIVSAENGADLPDLMAYTREVMRRVERDVGTKLQWLAANHHNTDNPHTHILLRGKRENGEDLVLPRQYISQGIRARASEVATEILGERTQEQVQQAKAQEVQAERFTSLDRMIERALEKSEGQSGGRINVAPGQRIGFGADDRLLVIGRLGFLGSLGLAQKARGTRWLVNSEFRQTLMELGARNDIIKQLYASLGNEAGHVHRMNAGSEPPAPVAGVVIAKGSVDEMGEGRFIVVRDASDSRHYARVRDDEEYRRLRVGSVAELGALDQRRRTIAQEIRQVASAHEGIYDPVHCESHLRAQEPTILPHQLAVRVRSAAARLTFLASYPAAGVERLEGERFRIRTAEFDRFILRPGPVTDIRVIAAHSLDEQVKARAWTWLDRHLFSQRPHREQVPVGGKRIDDASQRRREWLVANGHARQTGDNTIELLPGTAWKLSRQEQAAWSLNARKF